MQFFFFVMYSFTCCLSKFRLFTSVSQYLGFDHCLKSSIIELYSNKCSNNNSQNKNLLIDHELQNNFAARCVPIAEPMKSHDEFPGSLLLKQQFLT